MSELQELFEAKHPMPKGITRCGDHYAQTEYVLIDPYANEYSARFKGFVEAWNARQSEIDQLKAEKAGLENLLSLQRHKVKALEVELANSRDYSDGLHEKIHDVELQIAVHWGADEDTDSVLRDVEKALRGEHE